MLLDCTCSSSAHFQQNKTFFVSAQSSAHVPVKQTPQQQDMSAAFAHYPYIQFTLETYNELRRRGADDYLEVVHLLRPAVWPKRECFPTTNWFDEAHATFFVASVLASGTRISSILAWLLPRLDWPSARFLSATSSFGLTNGNIPVPCVS